MSKCVYCHERKGKRACPALNGLICSHCCGEHRMTRIACPSDCQYLDSSNDYQQKRSGERFAQARKDFYKDLFALGDDKAAALFNFIETITFGYFCDRLDGQDAEVITGIQSLRRNLSPLHIPTAMAPVFAEHLKKQYEVFSKQQGQPVPDTALATEVLDRVMKFATEFSGGGLQSSRFLNGLVGYIRTYHPQVAEHLAKQHDSGRIVLPGQFTPQPTTPAPHTHGPDCQHH